MILECIYTASVLLILSAHTRTIVLDFSLYINFVHFDMRASGAFQIHLSPEIDSPLWKCIWGFLFLKTYKEVFYA